MDLYTMVSRSKKGTIIIKNNLPTWIVSKEDNYTSEANTITKALPIFRKATMEELNSVKFPDEVTVEAPSAEKPKDIPKTTETLKEETKPLEDNKALNDPEKTKAT